MDVPEGVTLAGDRGREGSEGALLTSDALETAVMIRAGGPGVRVTGLRIRGPNSKASLGVEACLRMRAGPARSAASAGRGASIVDLVGFHDNDFPAGGLAGRKCLPGGHTLDRSG